MPSTSGVVEAVSRSSRHDFTKPTQDVIRLVTGLGVEGDAHAGATVQHLSRVRRDPTQPNLRQVHLVAAETLSELAGKGFDVSPGQIGENITTRGIPVFRLPTGTLLRLGPDAVVEVTGLRNPCVQLDRFRPGLTKALLGRDDEGRVTYRAGIMAVVRTDGDVRPDDSISVEFPAAPHRPLALV
jgi:MOSC domain-containing protein YiiM